MPAPRTDHEIRRGLGAVLESFVQEYARKFTAEQRREFARKGWAKPDGSFPVETVEDLQNAIGLARDASDRTHVKKQAARLGKSNLIPEEWAAGMKTCPACEGTGKVPQGYGS